MNKNLILVQNGFPGSATSGTEVDSLNINNFFKFEKSVVPSLYANFYEDAYYGTPFLSPYNFSKDWSVKAPREQNEIAQITMPSAWYEADGTLKYNNAFKHYSISYLLFAVRMQKGYIGSNVTVTSRLPSASPLKLVFYYIGDSLQMFKALNEIKYKIAGGTKWVYPYKIMANSIIIPSIEQYNHCFLAALFSDSTYSKESGTALLTDEPLLNISWTETAFVKE